MMLLTYLLTPVVAWFASLEIQLRGSVNTLGWSSPILYGFLTLGYAYFLYLRPEAS